MSPVWGEGSAATEDATRARDAAAGTASRGGIDEAARKRAAVELIRRDERTLRRTARRYSLCADDAEDAYQRALEILLTKAPTDDLRQLIRWMQTVTKHEALAVRRHRERILGSPHLPGRDDDEADWVQLIPSERDGPADLTERRERIARSREALQSLKPHELRALTLLAEGYSYAEISEKTGWSRTKINRCLAEGRLRFRALISSSEDGSRCEDLSPALSAFCDGEASPEDAATLREHLRACAHCRATLRTFRAAPPAAAALAPMAAAPSLFDRAHAAFAGLQSRLPGGSGAADSALSQVAASGGTKGAGLALSAKLLAACVGTAGGAAVCVAAGVIPAPIDLPRHRERAPTIERTADQPARAAFGLATDEPPRAEPASIPASPEAPGQQSPAPEPPPAPPAEPPPPPPTVEFSPEAAAPVAVSPPPPAAVASGSSGGSSAARGGAGEFGP